MKEEYVKQLIKKIREHDRTLTKGLQMLQDRSEDVRGCQTTSSAEFNFTDGRINELMRVACEFEEMFSEELKGGRG